MGWACHTSLKLLSPRNENASIATPSKEVDELNPRRSWIRNLLNLKRGKRIQVQDSRRVKEVEIHDKLIPMSSYIPRKIKEAGFEMVKIRAQRKHTRLKEKTLSFFKHPVSLYNEIEPSIEFSAFNIAVLVEQGWCLIKEEKSQQAHIFEAHCKTKTFLEASHNERVQLGQEMEFEIETLDQKSTTIDQLIDRDAGQLCVSFFRSPSNSPVSTRIVEEAYRKAVWHVHKNGDFSVEVHTISRQHPTG
ncbi:hypothetical protein POTOM_049027 [Populus tomentosa]|uniref:Uncharacterized protein n=1 Tax=Populus tomentosa TaxID=118781 RepID=A0A8X7YK17_POPTO|nr:hypothetical protein POTOM_049027 [Populus tomentosa]